MFTSEELEYQSDNERPTKTNEPCPKCGENLTVCDYDNGCSFYCEKCGFMEEYGSP